MNITVTQKNPLSLTLPHAVTNLVIKPVMQGILLEEMPLTTTIHELLFKVIKDGTVFWVGAAVPFGTTDFTRIQVFFHPTVVQAGVIHASDADYSAFIGGWSSSLQRYIALEGGQLAASRVLPMLVPFTTMAALQRGADNMFTADPVTTLSHITYAIQTTFIPVGLPPPQLTAVGVASFSSGITAMRMFINAMKPSGLVREVIDFDSPFIVSEPAALTLSPGAVSSCYTQKFLANPPQGYKILPASSFANLTSYNHDPHSCIGWMMYHTAMITSVIV
ncbi:hypothetical protein IYY11_11860 [Methylocystis sp. H62]|uniref:hypothetical protein n=1 Tax=Methylocystis sp. H62 TaxID=2785789 RepID=UPI0018C30CFE|nr:hypothetical protein [Methylocystis sp. H62]MBG0794066.1 hypothetical protein [Methylocystis sp. H62]